MASRPSFWVTSIVVMGGHDGVSMARAQTLLDGSNGSEIDVRIGIPCMNSLVSALKSWVDTRLIPVAHRIRVYEAHEEYHRIWGDQVESTRQERGHLLWKAFGNLECPALRVLRLSSDKGDHSCTLFHAHSRVRQLDCNGMSWSDGQLPSSLSTLVLDEWPGAKLMVG